MSPEQIPKNKEIFEGNEWQLETRIELIEPAQENFGKRLTESGWNEDEIYPLQLAFIEALVNAMAHGNLEVTSDEGTNIMTRALKKQQESPTDKKVRITLDITPNRALVTIKDEGKGFDWKNLKDPTAPEDILKPFGRGNLLMNAFDSITRNDAGNEVTMIKNRKTD